jgi:hypothetical protein
MENAAAWISLSKTYWVWSREGSSHLPTARATSPAWPTLFLIPLREEEGFGD